MEAITYIQALQNLAVAIEKVNNDHVPIIITSENYKPVVMISLEDFNAWQETAYLLRSSANARDLLEAVEEIKAQRNLIRQDLLEEI
ncbi:prevent-host-death family protein [Thioploca ingrica]|uniref:Antitoxin n=1 Tax=Thioploca ingrica TaxID=40754 RepID=A0A090AC57_9GAMM|nr:prevent-host-death family protein [Thioploca ingrica]